MGMNDKDNAIQHAPSADPPWWQDSPYAEELRALDAPGKRFLVELEAGCDNINQLLLLAIPTARLVDRMALINTRITADNLTSGGRPNRLLAELARIEKIYLMNLRSLGVCDKDESRKRQRQLWP